MQDHERDFAEEAYWRDHCSECDTSSPRCRMYGHADHWRGVSNENDRLTLAGDWIEHVDNAEQGVVIVHRTPTEYTEIDLSNAEFDRIARERGYVRG